jgi:N-acetylglucosamine-6-sulfatase
MAIVRKHIRLLVALALAALAGGIVLSRQDADASRRAALPPNAVPYPGNSLPGPQPNIVFVLTDDLSMNLLQYMPQVEALQSDGLTFNNYFVSDSLCCPSRSSIFTGDFPHDTGVFGNAGPHGGFAVFHARGDDQHTFAVALHQAGYRTAMMGKYLNGYLEPASGVLPTYIPPGWSEWDVAGDGYSEFNYTLNENGSLVHYGDQPDDYLTDVIARKGVDFINQSTAAGQPFFLELATFTPHHPFTPAPRDAKLFPGLTAPEGPSFDVLPTNAPRWLAGRPPLTAYQLQRINKVFRKRVQDVQSIDDLLTSIESALVADNAIENTYIVFSSDNGLHTGEYRLMPGKLTAFDTDIHVPLIVDGPGVPTDSQTNAMTENIDLAKTFTAIGGTTLPGDGHSLMPLLNGSTPTDWRNAILVEHHGPDLYADDPDYQSIPAGSPTTYEAMRTPDFLYVEYRDGEREYYDLQNDPFELHNLAGRLTASALATLHAELLAMEQCHGGPQCWAAMHVSAFLPALRSRHRH